MATNRLSAEQEIARRSRRSFLTLGVGAAAGVGGWMYLNSGAPEGDIPPALRSVLGFNERVVRSALYDNDHLARTYPATAIGKIKVNGEIGLDDDVDEQAWRLQVVPFGASGPASSLA